MSFRLSEEQKMIRAMAREFARNELIPTAAERDRNKTFPWEVFRKMSELGFMGMMVPEEYHGANVDTISYALALMEIAYGCASTAVVMSVHNSIVCEAICQYGSEYVKKTYLPGLAGGETIGAFALTEPNAGSDPVRQTSTAVRDGEHWIINGTKRFITTGQNCGLTIVTAVTQREKRHKGISAFVVEKNTPGFIVGKIEDKMGLRASDTTELIFEDCRIPGLNVLGEEGQGFIISMTCLDCGRIGIACQSVGVAQAALDTSINYAKGRHQFGRPISQFQGLRWILADMSVEIEAARLMALNAASQKDQGEPFTLQASQAKLFASEMVNRVCGHAIQIHGGYGYVKEFPVERYYRDARVFTIYEGTSEIQRVVISRELLR
jgi:alkylation response protein AidB-like acyl-CoA dehydrogenase